MERSIFMQIVIEKNLDGQLKKIHTGDVVDKCHYAINESKYPKLGMFVEDFRQISNILQPCPMKKVKERL